MSILAITIICTAGIAAPVLSPERLPVDVIPSMHVPSLDYASLEAEDIERETAGLMLFCIEKRTYFHLILEPPRAIPSNSVVELEGL